MLDRTRHASLPRHHMMHVPRTMFAAAIDRFGTCVAAVTVAAPCLRWTSMKS